jgi:hypothetical protein
MFNRNMTKNKNNILVPVMLVSLPYIKFITTVTYVLENL